MYGGAHTFAKDLWCFACVSGERRRNLIALVSSTLTHSCCCEAYWLRSNNTCAVTKSALASPHRTYPIRLHLTCALFFHSFCSLAPTSLLFIIENFDSSISHRSLLPRCVRALNLNVLFSFHRHFDTLMPFYVRLSCIITYARSYVDFDGQCVVARKENILLCRHSNAHRTYYCNPSIA